MIYLLWAILAMQVYIVLKLSDFFTVLSLSLKSIKDVFVNMRVVEVVKSDETYH